jgi:hypothetical protein
VSATALAEVAAHGLHLALFGAGLVTVAALLASTWGPRSRRRSHAERARLKALRDAARAGRLGSGPAADMRND